MLLDDPLSSVCGSEKSVVPSAAGTTISPSMIAELTLTSQASWATFSKRGSGRDRDEEHRAVCVGAEESRQESRQRPQTRGEASPALMEILAAAVRRRPSIRAGTRANMKQFSRGLSDKTDARDPACAISGGHLL
jgi:hypothetical protein